jgi:hypothetical protein
MADLELQEENIGAEQKKSTSGFKARVQDIVNERRRLARCVRDGLERKTGECSVEYDYDNGKILYREIESSIVVKERTMSIEERQLSLFGGE